MRYCYHVDEWTLVSSAGIKEPGMVMSILMESPTGVGRPVMTLLIIMYRGPHSGWPEKVPAGHTALKFVPVWRRLATGSWFELVQEVNLMGMSHLRTNPAMKDCRTPPPDTSESLVNQ
jgi:hypothetical protein